MVPKNRFETSFPQNRGIAGEPLSNQKSGHMHSKK